MLERGPRNGNGRTHQDLFLILMCVVLGSILCFSTTCSPQKTKQSVIEKSGTDLITPPHSEISETTTLLENDKKRISGHVLQEAGPISGAVVRIQATDNKTVTDIDGSFILSGLDGAEEQVVTAWAAGFYIGSVKTLPGSKAVTITLKPYYTTDNAGYNWFSHEGAQGSLSCSHCMPCYSEWKADVHSQSAVNPRFLSMYNGTDIQGNKSPPTRYVVNRDYGRVPIPPDMTKLYFGPGYKLDFPDSSGNCVTCHVPGMATQPDQVYQADPNRASGIEKEGIFCEFCHKIGEVAIDRDTRLPDNNLPGTLSMRLFRPHGDQQMFFGNFDDVTRRVSYLPLFEESAYCASCHYGVFWKTVVYGSYQEWLESPYSNSQSGKTCQNCHMPAVDYPYFVYPEKGGLLRNPARIYSHKMPGAMDKTLLQNALTMAVKADREGDDILVRVILTNDKTGHHIPTDSPLRHLILIVQAKDIQQNDLKLADGPTIPEWAGVGNPENGYYAGLPGKIYAKILSELWTEISPSASYWNQTEILSDNRLAAFGTDESQYRFRAPDDTWASIRVRLIYRRAFISIMEEKGWDIPDIEMEATSISIK